MTGKINTPDGPLHARLYNRFYKDGHAVMGESASSHWKECGRRFEVRPSEVDNFDLFGYGFGSSSSSSLASRISAWVGNTLQLVNLRLDRLRQDVREAKAVVRKMGLHFSQDAFRQVCTLNLLSRHVEAGQPTESILIIGDGHGVLAALMHTRWPRARIFLADLGPVLFFQAYHLNMGFPEATQTLTDEPGDEGNPAVFNFIPSDRLDTFPSIKLDLAVNVASMQEMDPVVTANYFRILRERNTALFYCCNRLEKHLGGGGLPGLWNIHGDLLTGTWLMKRAPGTNGFSAGVLQPMSNCTGRPCL